MNDDFDKWYISQPAGTLGGVVGLWKAWKAGREQSNKHPENPRIISRYETPDGKCVINTWNVIPTQNPSTAKAYDTILRELPTKPDL